MDKCVPVFFNNSALKPLRIANNVHSSASRFPYHYHNCHEILLIVDGSGYIDYKKKIQYPISPFTVVFIARGESLQIIDNPGSYIQRYSIWFKDNFFGLNNKVGRLCGNLSKTPFAKRIISIYSLPLLTRLPDLFREIFNLHNSLDKKNTSDDYKTIWFLQQQNRLLDILLLLQQCIIQKKQEINFINNKKYNRLENAIQYIRENFYKKIRLEDVAGLTTYSSRQFVRYFRQIMKMSFTHYVNILRITEAQKRLNDKNSTIASACFESGFNELAYFYRVFKQITGSTPRRYLIDKKVQ